MASGLGVGDGWLQRRPSWGTAAGCLRDPTRGWPRPLLGGGAEGGEGVSPRLWLCVRVGCKWALQSPQSL